MLSILEKEFLILYDIGMGQNTISRILGESPGKIFYKFKTLKERGKIKVSKRKNYFSAKEVLDVLDKKDISISDKLKLNITRYYNTMHEEFGNRYVQIINLYNNDYTRIKISKITKYPITTVCKALLHYRETEIENEEFIEKKNRRFILYLHNNGYSNSAISILLNISTEYVENILRKVN